MGSCYYYLKIRDCKKDDVEKIQNFIIEGSKSEDWWQNHRDYERSRDPNLTREKFWLQFDAQFPMTSEYLKFIGKHGGDCDNELAGVINFGSDDDVEYNFYFEPDYTDEDGVVYGELKYSAEIWHFSDWDWFTEYLKHEFKLKDVNWISEEDMNPYDLL